MIPNPYVPPGAEVADPLQTHPSPPRPVKSACVLILVALALGVVTVVPGVRTLTPDEAAVPFIVNLGLFLVFGGLTVWFAIEILRGKNWARWAMLLYLLLGWILVGVDLNNDVAAAPLVAIIDTVSIVMEVVACGLLFFGAGARWFAELAEQRRAQATR